MKRASESIVAKVIGKSIYLESKHHHSIIMFFGATMPVSCSPTSPNSIRGGYENFTLYPVAGEEGIIAINIHQMWHSGKNTTLVDEPTFLHVKWNESGTPIIDLEAPWISSERIGQVTRHGIEVEIDGTRLKTPTVDGNLLCRYLWGTASKEDVLSMITAKEEEISATERLKEFEKSHAILLRERDEEIRLLTSLLEVKSAAHREAVGAIKEINAFIRIALQDLGKFRRHFMPQSWQTLGDVSARIENDFEPRIRDAA